ncbi:hypothetical protein BT69DRAFT_1009977 [Atractiella rhizophila]|nr:hypothetical protein BT69DRAFT_1009977 [Atractiella rhizophila]
MPVSPTAAEGEHTSFSSLFKRRHRHTASTSSSQSTNTAVETPGSAVDGSMALSKQEVSGLLKRLGFVKPTVGAAVSPSEQRGIEWPRAEDAWVPASWEESVFTKRRESQRPDREEKTAGVQERDELERALEESKKAEEERRQKVCVFYCHDVVLHGGMGSA